MTKATRAKTEVKKSHKTSKTKKGRDKYLARQIVGKHEIKQWPDKFMAR